MFNQVVTNNFNTKNVVKTTGCIIMSSSRGNATITSGDRKHDSKSFQEATS